jgi:hypothetical protein
LVSAAAAGVMTWQWISTVALRRPVRARARSGEAWDDAGEQE